MAKKSENDDVIEVDVSNIYVLETKEYPFRGLNLKQITYLINIEKAINVLKAILEAKAKL